MRPNGGERGGIVLEDDAQGFLVIGAQGAGEAAAGVQQPFLKLLDDGLAGDAGRKQASDEKQARETAQNAGSPWNAEGATGRARSDENQRGRCEGFECEIAATEILVELVADFEIANPFAG